MNSETEQAPVARMELPPPRGAIGVIVLAGLITFFTSIAIVHLVGYSDTPTYGIVASILWLGLVALICWLKLRLEGLRAAAIACLGEFSLRHFVEVSHEGGRTVVDFGYELFRRRFHYLHVEREHVVSVDMSLGQASAIAGRDMNDWHVALWYRDPTRAPRASVAGVRDEAVYGVGPVREKLATGEFFRQFVALLNSAGVELYPTEKEHEFRTSPGSASLTPPSPPSPSA